MRTGHGVLAVVGAAALALLIGSAWLVGFGKDDAEAARVGNEAPAAPPASLPDLAAEVGERQPIALPVASSADIDLANLERGEDRVSGRVVDATGQPVFGADVWLVPERHTLAWMGFDAMVSSVERQRWPLERFAHVRTSADGSFRIASGRWRDGRRVTSNYSMQESWLLILHEGFAPARAAVRGAGDQELQLPDVVLGRPAASVMARVVDERGVPISGAELRVRNGAALYSWSEGLGTTAAILDHVRIELQLARSDADGRVSLGGLEPGESHALVEEPAHGSALFKRFVLREGESLDLGEIVLRRRLAILTGRIEDDRGRPVAGADVIVADRYIELPADHAELHGLVISMLVTGWSLHTPVGRSDGDGVFAVGPFDSPTVIVLAEAEGFEPTLVEACNPSAGPITIVLEPKREFLLRIRDESTGANVSGARLLAAEHEPVAEIIYKLPDRRTRATTWEATTAADGGDALRIRGGCSEPLLVTVEAPGYASSRVPVACPEAAGEEAVVSLAREAVVTGRAVTAEGLALAGVEVNLAKHKEAWLANAWKGPPKWRGPIWTGPDGGFHLEGLEAGEWELMLDGVERSMTPRRIELEAGERYALGDVVIPRRGRILGRVVLGDGQPGADFRVQATDGRIAGLGGGRRTVSDAQGRFLFEGLSAGRWKLQAQRYENHLSHDAVTAELTDGESLEVDVPGLRGPRTVGRVLAGGQPVAGAQIAINEDATADSWSTYDSIEVSAEDGSFELEFWNDRSVSLIAIAPWGGSSRPVTSPSGWNEVLNADLILASGELSGVVQSDATGLGLGGIEVELFGPWWDGAVDPVRTDEHGRFRFEHVSAHDYSIRCVDPTGAHATLETGPWTLVDGERRDDLQLRVALAATIVGTMTWGDGLVAPNGTPAHLYVAGEDRDLRFVAVADGRFVFDGLAPGRYEVAAGAGRMHHGGFAKKTMRAMLEVQLEPGERREIQLDLPRR